jgi:hypothetical protein
MDNGSQALIRLDNVSKVFVTDEVETHALSGIHFEVKKGEYRRSRAPRAAESPPCSRFWACSIRPATEPTT